jgi:hypothetical protein
MTSPHPPAGHGYADVERGAEILHVALEDALDYPDEPEGP